MSEMPKKTGEDELLTDLEAAVRKILKSTKSKAADKLAAIKAGVAIAHMRHKINAGEPETGFFDR